MYKKHDTGISRDNVWHIKCVTNFLKNNSFIFNILNILLASIQKITKHNKKYFTKTWQNCVEAIFFKEKNTNKSCLTACSGIIKNNIYISSNKTFRLIQQTVSYHYINIFLNFTGDMEISGNALYTNSIANIFYSQFYSQFQ